MLEKLGFKQQSTSSIPYSNERSIKSKVIKSQEIEETDESRLSRAVRDAGRYADGIAAVEVWILDDIHLVRPDGGWWRDPNFEALDEDALDRIEDQERDDYVVPPPQLPGTGLAGGLWTADESHDLVATTRTFLFGTRHHNTEEEKSKNQAASSPRSRRASSMPFRKAPIWSSFFSMERVSMMSKEEVAAKAVAAECLDISDHSNNSSPKANSMTNMPHHSFGSGSPNFRPKTQDHPETPEDPIEAATMKIAKEDNFRDASFNSRASRAPPRQSAASNNRRSSFMTRASAVMFGRNLDLGNQNEPQHGESPHRGTEMLWRDIYSLTVDPDQPTFLRLKLLEDAGFAKATEVRFEFRGQKGIVLYLAKSGTAMERLSSSENCAYMRSAADLVGAAVSLIKTKRAILAHKASAVLVAEPTTTVIKSEQKEDRKIVHNIKVWARKLKGGDLQPPPPMPSKEAALTFFGSFLTLLILSRVSEGIKGASDNKYFIVLGPFGALVSTSYAP
jgi:hypothetical protein